MSESKYDYEEVKRLVEALAPQLSLKTEELEALSPYMYDLSLAAEKLVAWGGFSAEGKAALGSIVTYMLGFNRSAYPFLAEFFGLQVCEKLGVPVEQVGRGAARLVCGLDSVA